MKTKSLLSTALLLTGFALAAAPGAHAQLTINGAGATFPNPLYSKWFDTYRKVDPSVQFNYQAIGSGGGQKQITEQTVDFGASDGPMSDENLAKAPGKLLHIPTVAGAVVITYNAPGVNEPQARRPRARRHLPGQDHQMERRGHRQAKQGRETSRRRDQRRAPLGRLGHQLHLHGLPEHGQPRVEVKGRARTPA